MSSPPDNRLEIMEALETQLGVRDSICCFIGSARAEHAEKVEAIVEELAHRLPWARVVGSETSDAERASLRAAQMTGLRTTVIQIPRKGKGQQGEWYGSPGVRDEQILSECTDAFFMDDSARCKDMEKTAKRMVTKRIWRLH